MFLNKWICLSSYHYTYYQAYKLLYQWKNQKFVYVLDFRLENFPFPPSSRRKVLSYDDSRYSNRPFEILMGPHFPSTRPVIGQYRNNVRYSVITQYFVGVSILPEEGD